MTSPAPFPTPTAPAPAPAPAPSRPPRSKYYIPLESDPDLFTSLIHTLGLPRSWAYVDVLSLTEEELLGFVPRPVGGLVLIFPDSGGGAGRYAETWRRLRVRQPQPGDVTLGGEGVQGKGAGEGQKEKGKGEGEEGDDDGMIWFPQTIGNACGLYAILHSVCNGPARGKIQPDTPLARLLEQVAPLSPAERALALEQSSEIEHAHRSTALRGQTAPPDAEAEVEHHYVAFVRSHLSKRLYLMDGVLEGPVDLGEVGWGEDGGGDGDLLSEEVRRVVREFVGQGEGGFALMALVEDGQ